ncbi:MAG: hypothetical protein HQK65_01990 [Desulfamplus sp.]|nr:hypothetical protein [Desulfamplus sp.]
MTEYQIFKDLISILGPRKTLKTISKKLHGIVDLQNIAFCIFNTSGDCPLCNNSGVNNGKCPICSSNTNSLINYYQARIQTYPLILRVIKKIWEEELLNG